jgi:hypothetical protein
MTPWRRLAGDLLATFCAGALIGVSMELLVSIFSAPAAIDSTVIEAHVDALDQNDALRDRLTVTELRCARAERDARCARDDAERMQRCALERADDVDAWERLADEREEALNVARRRIDQLEGQLAGEQG